MPPRKLPSAVVIEAGNLIGVVIRRAMPRAEMDAAVLDGAWSPRVEALRERVAGVVGGSFSQEAWELGKVEAWRMYADEVGEQWPKRTA